VGYIKGNNTLRLLSCATGIGELLGAPSWAPDWRCFENASPFTRYREKTGFCASGNTSINAWFSDHGLTLNTKGIIVDPIKATGSEPKHGVITALVLSTKVNVKQLHQTKEWLQECYDQAWTSRMGCQSQGASPIIGYAIPGHLPTLNLTHDLLVAQRRA